MATFQFNPTINANVAFQATLDGTTYSVAITWNVYRIDWYLNVYDQSNNLIVSRAFVGSPPLPESGINLVAPWFLTSTMYYYPSSSTIVVSP